jgi:MoaA/NifB/PqqE/SkfB family radical SAM enzyme
MKLSKILEVGTSYAQSLYSFHTDGQPRPFSASFAVTNKCNLKCVYCDLPNIKTQELSLEEIETLFQVLKKMGVKRLGIFGGEPLVRKDICAILELAKKYEFFISLNSNLLLYDRYRDNLDIVDYFFTSIDGTPEKHQKNRGKQKFEIITNAIEDIVSRGKKVTIICVITDSDKESVDYVIDLAKKTGADVHFQQENYDSYCAGRVAPDELENEKIRDTWRYILSLKKKGAPITSSYNYLKFIIGWHNYKQSSYYDENIKCMAGSGFISIDPTGTAYPCIFVQGKFEGVNLLKEDWQKVFNKKTPCTTCIVGPLLEYNLLFKKPIRSSIEALKKAL